MTTSNKRMGLTGWVMFIGTQVLERINTKEDGGYTLNVTSPYDVQVEPADDGGFHFYARTTITRSGHDADLCVRGTVRVNRDTPVLMGVKVKATPYGDPGSVKYWSWDAPNGPVSTAAFADDLSASLNDDSGSTPTTGARAGSASALGTSGVMGN